MMKTVLLGDSFTRGFGVPARECWASRLSDKAEISCSREQIILNKGINGETTSGMLARFNNDVIKESPRYVVITGGLNDFICGCSVSDVQSNYMAMVHQAFHNKIIPIVAAAPEIIPSMIRPQWLCMGDYSVVLEKQAACLSALRTMSQAFNLYMLDFYHEFNTKTTGIEKSRFYIDGLHLTSSGHELIGDIAFDFIKTLRGGAF